MTRRERHLNILAWMGDHRVRWELQRLVSTRDVSLLSDEGVEKLTAATVRAWRHEKKTNRENRQRLIAAGLFEVRRAAS